MSNDPLKFTITFNFGDNATKVNATAVSLPEINPTPHSDNPMPSSLNIDYVDDSGMTYAALKAWKNAIEVPHSDIYKDAMENCKVKNMQPGKIKNAVRKALKAAGYKDPDNVSICPVGYNPETEIYEFDAKENV